MAKVAILGLLALLVVIIVGIALAVYFTSKKSKSDGEEPSEKKPELTFNADATKTINPQEEDNGTQEGYAVEYAGGESIDLTLSWNNGQGFDGVVNKLIFTRYVKKTKDDDENNWVKIQDDKETEKASEISDNGSGSVTFSGTGVYDRVDTKGWNVVRAYYNEMKPENLLATAELEITDDDFDQVMTGEFSEIVIPVTIPKDSFKLDKTIKKTYYNLSLDTRDESTQLRLVESWYTIKQNGDKYTFTGSTGQPLTLNGNTEFKIQKYQGKNILLRASDDKIYYDDGDNDGAYITVDQMSTDKWEYAKFNLKSRMSSGFPTGPPGIDGVNSVWYGFKGKIEYLNIAQIEVYSNGVNIVKNKKSVSRVTVGSTYETADNKYGPDNLFDGNYDSIYHSALKFRREQVNYVKIDFDKRYTIDSVKIFNRKSCGSAEANNICNDRWAGTYVALHQHNPWKLLAQTPLIVGDHKENGVRVKTFTSKDFSPTDYYKNLKRD